MVMGQEFLGVYASHEVAPSLGDFPRHGGKRKRLWFVWELPDGGYSIQALNAVLQPMDEPRVITAQEFERFTAEQDCFAVPEGYEREEEPEETIRAPLPDLFANGAEPLFPILPHEATPDGEFRADSPDLLKIWAQSEPRIRNRGVNPAKIPFDRLVGESIPEERTIEEASQPVRLASEQPLPEEARLLRSKFVQALLLLRRGEKNDSTAILQDMLAKKYPPFEGAAQLFSEFGLGLRRLGLINLALAAHTRAWEYANDDERILFNIARSYHDLGLLDEARDSLAKAIAIAPDFEAAKQFLTFLDIGPQKGV